MCLIGASISINRRLSRRPRFPAPMQPEPLVRIPPHVVLNDAGKTLRIFANVDCILAGASQSDCGLEAEPVFPELGVPGKKPRGDPGIGMVRQRGKSPRG